jgi:dGTPase
MEMVKYKEFLSAKEWQDLIDFEGNANGFTVLTGTRPGRRVFVFLMLH